MLYISNTVHALSFSALTVFAWVGNTNKLVVGPTTRPGNRQEQWYHLWRSRFRHYLCAHLTFGDQMREWKAQYSRPLFWGWNVEPRWQRALASLLAAFIEVWCILIFCSGGLAYMWQWRIGYKQQSTIFHNIYCPRCKRYVSRSCLKLHYQWRTGTYCINSLAFCKEVHLPQYWYFSSVFTDRVSPGLLSRWRIV